MRYVKKPLFRGPSGRPIVADLGRIPGYNQSNTDVRLFCQIDIGQESGRLYPGIRTLSRASAGRRDAIVWLVARVLSLVQGGAQ